MMLSSSRCEIWSDPRSVANMHCIGIDFVQEKFLGQGAQDNESAAEQAKDEQISDYIRGQHKTTTGNDIPIKDKERF